MTWKAAAFVVVAVLSAVCVFVADWVNSRAAQRFLAGRPTLSPVEFGARYSGESQGRAQIATTTREILGRHLELDLAGLSPEDRPVQDLSMDELDSMSTVE